MIETEQTIVVDVPVQQAWDYVQHIPKWANLMPGLQDCDVLDANDSRWTLKVGVGGMVRTVKVFVHVDEWAGPERALFTYNVEGDPVEGGGSYAASAIGPGQSEITLTVRVKGSGPLAPMWEAMGKPMLPKFVRGFAEQLKAEIEGAAGVAGAAVAASPRPMSIGAWLRHLWRGLFGKTG